MRFDELSLRIPGDELRMRFHERLTVLTGIGALERQALIDGLLGTLTGASRQSTALTYRDALDQRIIVTSNEHGGVTCTFDDGMPAPDLMGQLRLDFTALTQLCRVSASDVGMVASMSEQETPELAEARATLRTLTEELEAATSARESIEAMRLELEALEERIRDYDDGQARRRYARLLAELEHVRAEAAAIRGGETQAEADRRFLANAGEAARLSERWRQARAALAAARAAFGDRERLDRRTFEEAQEVPDRVPEELDHLVRALEAAESRRDELNARLQELAAKELPQPSTQAVIRLAHADQEAVWAAARAVVETEHELERASLDLGGLPAEGTVSELAEQLEAVHGAVDEAEREMERRRQRAVVLSSLGGIAAAGAVFVLLPLAMLLLAAAAGAWVWGIRMPQRQLRTARAVEDAVLEKAGIGSYLGFHIRRIDATIDPGARDRISVAALAHRAAQSHWHEVAGNVPPTDALELEQEVRAYASALATLDGRADKIEHVRRQLVDEAEPAVAWALAQLMEACAPFGVDDPKIAAGMVRHQAELARTARLQRELEAAEAADAEASADMSAVLTKLGFVEGDADARIAAVQVALNAARERELARTDARPRDIVEAELAQLETLARREYQPEWGSSVEPDATEELDIEELRAQRDSAERAYETAARMIPDVGRLADRRNAVERRVTVLEAQLAESPSGGASVDVGEVEKFLLSRLSSVRSVGDGSEALPVILDEPFQPIRGERKWEILDLVERLSKSAQIVYLSNDPDVQLWARRRAAGGTLLLLEPVSAHA